jgi:hypothetical protein
VRARFRPVDWRETAAAMLEAIDGAAMDGAAMDGRGGAV